MNEILCKTTFSFLSSPELPVRFVQTLEEENTVVKSQPMYLCCELNKERDVVWTKDGNVIKDVPGKIILSIIGLAHSITVMDADDDDAGIYTVTVQNANDLSCQSNVKVVGELWVFFSQNCYLCVATKTIWLTLNQSLSQTNLSHRVVVKEKKGRTS